MDSSSDIELSRSGLDYDPLYGENLVRDRT